MSQQGFTITETGFWPREKYIIRPLTNIINVGPNTNFYSFFNKFYSAKSNYYHLSSFSGNQFPEYYTSNNINYTTLTELGLIPALQFTSTTNSFFTLDSLPLRRYDLGRSVNFFKLTLDSSDISTVNDDIVYGYLFYPKRLFLRPISAQKISDTSYKLTCSAVLLSATAIYFNNPSPENIEIAPKLNNEYLFNIPEFVSLGNSVNNQCILHYGLSSNQVWINKPIINYSVNNQNLNINQFQTILENQNYTNSVRRDFNFLSFIFQYFTTDSVPESEDFNKEVLETFSNIYFDDPIASILPFSRPIGFEYNPAQDEYKQSFYMVQSGINLQFSLESPQNSVLYGIFDLKSTLFRYFVRQNSRTFLNLVTGVAGTSFKISYINDSSNIFHTTEPVQNTLLNYYIHNNSNLPLTTPLSSTTPKSDLVTFTTKHPPHYYAYNLSMEAMPNGGGNQADYNRPTEINNLTFHLSSFATNRTASSVFVSTYLTSDYNCLTLDLPSYAVKDKIRYVYEGNDDFLFQSVSSYTYPNGVKTYYNLKQSSWIDASKNSVLELTYPETFLGVIGYTIRASLSTLAGRKDAIKNSTINLIGLYQKPEYSLILESIKEGDDFIDVTAESMITEEVYPGLDLRDSSIIWYINPNNSDIVANYLAKDEEGNYNPVNTISKNTPITFNTNTWAIRVSGYGPTPITITLSSKKYNNTVTISSDPNLFNFFAENEILIGPSVTLNNLPEVRTITLTAAVPYKGRLYNLPTNLPIFWNWTYNNTLNSLITAQYTVNHLNNQFYDASEIELSQSLSSLKFLINPNKTNTNPIGNTISISLFTTDTIIPYTGNYNLVVDDFPSKQVFNADFSLRYRTFPDNVILNTRNNEKILTRPDTGTSKYLLVANTDIVPLINARNYRWDITRSTSPSVSTVFGLTSINLDTDGILETNVTFTILSAIVPSWQLPHNISESIKINTINSTTFNRSPRFEIYPQFAWQNKNITILNDSNFRTFAATTTSYAFRKSNSEFYRISAFPSNNTYKYSYGVANTPIIPIDNFIEIPYNTQFSSNSGIVVSLTGYNDLFPENTPLRYQIVEGSNLVTRNYNITANTISYRVGINNAFRFRQNPKLIDYNDILQNYTLTYNVYDLDVNRIIYVNQTISNSPNNTPAFPEVASSTITYILSTSKWKAYKDVPSVNGTYPLFTLRTGDDLTPLTVDGNKLNTLRLNVSANLNIKIPQSTFDDYAFFQYSGERDLWNTKNIKLTSNLTPISNWSTLVAYSTSTAPEIFFNTYYTLTSNSVFVEFLTPTYDSNPIVSYAVNFGDNTTKIQNINTTFSHQYNSIGTFFVTYSAIQQNGSFKKFFAPTPFIVKEFWPEYNQESIRILNEKILKFPFSLEDISIQPNEFGDSDIFNTSLTRIDDCLNYLKDNSQTMNVDAPIVYYGWLGSNILNQSSGIRWFTTTYGTEGYNTPNNTSSSGTSYFTDIRDIKFSSNYIYVLDDKNFRLFNKDKNASEISFDNKSELINFFVDPKSMTISENDESIYIADSIRHKIYRFDFDFSNIEKPIASLVLTLGSFGSLNDANKFDYPSEIAYQSQNLYVLDFNNNCIKQYSKDLSWIFTYYDDIFANDQLQNIAIHPTGLLYALGKSLKIYIFDSFGEKIFKTIELSEISQESNISKIFFDDVGEFLYVVTSRSVFKYSAIGEYITTLNLPTNSLDFVSGANSDYKSINIASKNSILRFQDFVEIFRIGEGIDTQSWSLDQILLKKEEFAQDLNYNAALQKIAQNLKIFRSSLNSKFVLVSEQTSRGIVTYYSLVPLNIEDRPVFHPDVEAERLYIGTNEFHIPSVVNRELEKLYISLESMKNLLNVTDSNTNTSTTDEIDTGCAGSFCWSWKAMSCYDLSLPIIRLCNINPITYAELTNSFPINYAPTKIWGQATSNCCNDFVSPLDK